MIAAIENRKADRLPATTHHLQEYYLNTYEGGASETVFFQRHGLDPIRWIQPVKPDESDGQYLSDPETDLYRGIVSDRWRITGHIIPHAQYRTIRYTIETPDGTLSMVEQRGAHTSWLTEHPMKKKKDIDLIAKHAPAYLCDIQEAQRASAAAGDEYLVRSSVPSFDIYGQPGCWQDAAVMVGVQELIMAVYDDPA